MTASMSTSAAPPRPPADGSGPRQVSRFEFNLITILRFLLGYAPLEQARRALHEKFTPPACLSRAAVELVEDTLAKGLVLHLVRAGGWRRDQFLRGGVLQTGRIWERNSVETLGLDFTPRVLSFLIWLTAEKVSEPRTVWHEPLFVPTAGDDLFFALAIDALRAEPGCTETVRHMAAFHANPLCWLRTPGDFADIPELETPDFTSVCSGAHAAILECWQPLLAQHWIRSERVKGQIGDWKTMRQLGAIESRGLSAFLSTLEKAERPDLAGFLLQALSTILEPSEPRLTFWLGGLHGSGPPRLADRLETQRAGLAFIRQTETLARWDQHARTVGYFDEGYALSQYWKELWEAHQGPVLLAKARTLLEQVEPLRTTTTENSPNIN